MSKVTDAIREHHKEISARIAETATKATAEGATPDDVDALVRVLREDLLPHAAGEEKQLYPAVDPLVAARGRATATMSIDHEHIAAYVKALGVVSERIRAASDAATRTPLLADARDITHRLRAILELHTEKEERIYLPLIDTAMPAAEQEQLLQRIHEAAERTAEERTLDPAGLRA